MAKEYRLIPAEVPNKQRGGKSLYASILDEFLDSKDVSVKVEVPDRKPSTVCIGLRGAIKTSGATVRVLQRGPDVYLVK